MDRDFLFMESKERKYSRVFVQQMLLFDDERAEVFVPDFDLVGHSGGNAKVGKRGMSRIAFAMASG